ncbi:purine permease 1 [Capsicum galapagoense]
MESQTAIANPTMKKILILVNSAILFTSTCAGPLTTRLYFVRGGSRIWLSCTSITGGFPLTIFLLVIAYFHRKKSNGLDNTKIFLMTRKLFIASVISGLVTGMVNYFYSYGSAKLPVSTSCLLSSTQLVFTAIFAFIIVKQKFTSYSINAVVLLTIGAGILALGANSDRPRGESSKTYIAGFIMILLAALFYGFVLAFNEVSFRKTKKAIAFTLVLEFQMMMCFFATAFCVVGMLINKDFQAIPRDAKQFELGEDKYYMVIVLNALIWQIYFVGAVGVTCYSSALLSGILIAASLSVTEVIAVIFFHEKFGGEKGFSLALSLWGFVSYFYGATKQNKKRKNINTEVEVTQSPPI